MFIVSLNYICGLDAIDRFLDEHVVFLQKQYALGRFIASGRKVPRTGGVILVQCESRSQLEKILEEDPFQREGLADYQIQEFMPTMAAEGLESLLE